MIVDVHTHLFSDELCPRYWVDLMADYGAQVSGKPRDHVLARMRANWFDESGDLLIQDMDAAGIDKSVVFAMDFGPYSGVDDSISLERRYAKFHEAVKRHPERLVLFGGIDPRRPDAVAFIERAVEEHEIRGIKLWPPAGFYPNAPYCYRLYEACARLKLPVVVHTGLEITPFVGQTTQPMFVDQPASDFPEVTFVLAHAGMGWWQEAAEIAYHRSNVYLDTAYWQGKYLRLGSELFIREFRSLLSAAGIGKVMFGSDWPALRTVKGVKPEPWMDAVRRYPESAPHGVTFSREEIEAYLGGAAAKALRLDGTSVSGSAGSRARGRQPR